MGHGQGGILAQLWKFSWLTNIIWGGTGILTCVLGALYIYQVSVVVVEERREGGISGDHVYTSAPLSPIERSSRL